MGRCQRPHRDQSRNWRSVGFWRPMPRLPACRFPPHRVRIPPSFRSRSRRHWRHLSRVPLPQGRQLSFLWDRTRDRDRALLRQRLAWSFDSRLRHRGSVAARTACRRGRMRPLRERSGGPLRIVTTAWHDQPGPCTSAPGTLERELRYAPAASSRRTGDPGRSSERRFGRDLGPGVGHHRAWHLPCRHRHLGRLRTIPVRGFRPTGNSSHGRLGGGGHTTGRSGVGTHPMDSGGHTESRHHRNMCSCCCWVQRIPSQTDRADTSNNAPGGRATGPGICSDGMWRPGEVQPLRTEQSGGGDEASCRSVAEGASRGSGVAR